MRYESVESSVQGVRDPERSFWEHRAGEGATAHDGVLEPSLPASPGLSPVGRPHVTLVGDVPIFWTDLGAGAPLVLLHGVGDTHRTWRRLAPLLAPRFHVLMPDLPGHGFSGRPDASYALDWYADVLDAWMGAIGLAKAHVCGHSYGGGVAQCLVMAHRERVDRLALVASGGLGQEVALSLRLASLDVPERLFFPRAMWLGSRLAMSLDPHTFGYPEPAEIDESARVNARPGSGRAFVRTVRAVIGFHGQTRQTCKEVAIVRHLPPIALFWGATDRVLPVSHARMAAERFHGATLSVFRECGHFPHLHVPGRLADELTTFLDDPESLPATLLFACPDGPRSSGPDALPVGRCETCTFRQPA